MEKIKQVFSGLQQKIDGALYKCEYVKNCEKANRQCWQGGNSYCGEYKKRSSQKQKRN